VFSTELSTHASCGSTKASKFTASVDMEWETNEFDIECSVRQRVEMWMKWSERMDCFSGRMKSETRRSMGNSKKDEATERNTISAVRKNHD